MPWWAVYLALTVVPAVVLIMADANGGRAAYDSTIYHERVIREYVGSLPRPDVSNPLTTTIPGYHVLFALFARITSEDILVLRLGSLAIGVLFLVVAARSFGRWAGARNGLLLAMPLAACSYVLGSSAWLLPDNLSWLFVMSCLALNIESPSFRAAMAWNGVLLLAAVGCRQVNIWLAAVIVANAFAGGWPGLGDSLRERCGRAAVALAAVLPAALVLAWFAAVWRGLTPPRFQTDVYGVNFATPGFLLFQFTALGAFFLPWLWTPLRDFLLQRPRTAAAIAAAGFLVAAIPATVPGECWGRYAGWWRLLEALPVVKGHASLPIVLAAPFGAVALVASLAALRRRERVVLAVAVIAFGAAMTCTYYSWQRYHEPFILLLLGTLSALQWRGRIEPRSAVARVGAIAALTVVLAGLTYANFSTDRVDRDEPPAIFHLSEEERKAWKYDEWTAAHPKSRQARELEEIRASAREGGGGVIPGLPGAGSPKR